MEYGISGLECTLLRFCLELINTTTDLSTMDWQLPDIGKTITNNILPSSLSAYVSGDTVIQLIGGSRLFPCISVSCRVIPMDTDWSVYSRKN